MPQGVTEKNKRTCVRISERKGACKSIESWREENNTDKTYSQGDGDKFLKH